MCGDDPWFCKACRDAELNVKYYKCRLCGKKTTNRFHCPTCIDKKFSGVDADCDIFAGGGGLPATLVF